MNHEEHYSDEYAFLPNNKLLFSLTSKTYFKLGLEGPKSTLYRTKNIKKYRFEIDLLKESFIPEKRNYQRTYECLKRANLTCDFIIKFQPKQSFDGTILNYFQWLKNEDSLPKLQITTKYPKIRTFTNRNILMFNEKIDLNSEECENCLNRFIEWSSGQFCEIKDFGHNTNDEDENDGNIETNIYCIEIVGFFISKNIENLLGNIRSTLETSQTSCLIVHGYEESPQSWLGSGNEHHKELSGDNVYGFASITSQNLVCSFAIGDEFDYGIERF